MYAVVAVSLTAVGFFITSLVLAFMPKRPEPAPSTTLAALPSAF